MADLSQAIEDAASSPKSVTVDGQTVTGRSIDELVKAAEYLGRKAVGRSSRPPIRFAKLRPDGTT